MPALGPTALEQLASPKFLQHMCGTSLLLRQVLAALSEKYGLGGAHSRGLLYAFCLMPRANGIAPVEMEPAHGIY